MKTAFLFSGQGSQCEGMGVELADNGQRYIFDEASEILGFDLYDKCKNASAEELAVTTVAQPAIMAVSLAMAEDYRQKGITAGAVAGHSLGEYAALVYSGMVSRADGFRLIKARSEAMQRAAETAKGAMYAVIGMDAAQIEKICSETEGYVLPVNYNSPIQTVIAGEDEAAKAAADKCVAEGARKAVKLAVASAFHSKLMQSAADEFVVFARTVEYKAPQITVMSNVTGKAFVYGEEDMAERLARHIVSPVRFVDEINALWADGYDTYYECGPGKVLSGLVRKTLKQATVN
ncbi:MAG: ACP S-malonyltransferase [Oscillospiraceae bacterium]|nr:ACP S-malonyltransferase [Oscillospiraceae bacterium]